MPRRSHIHSPRPHFAPPGPSRLFLYAEAAVLLILGVSLLSSYVKQYPPSSQTGGGFYQIADTSGESASGGPETPSSPSQPKKFIKWVDFTVTCEAMTKALRLDIDTVQEEPHLNWIELLAFLGARYGGDFSRYKASHMDALAQKLQEGKTMAELTEGLNHYDYYLEAYSAVLGGMVGTFEAEMPLDQVPEGVSCRPARTVPDAEGSSRPETVWITRYGLKAFSPIAKGFPYSEFDDFGAARSYGFKRQHLGHDMMGQVGSPVIAVESGTVEALGWNQYGGWRIGIRSFDRKRYYYYAHLRKNYPYQSNLSEGVTVQAGDVIGYMGRTGYSRTENTNNIDEPHLHFGLQLIFDESQKDGNNEIWISCYELVKFLRQNQSLTEKIPDTKEWHRVYRTCDFQNEYSE